MKIFIHYTDHKRLFRINISPKCSYIELKRQIYKIAKKKQIELGGSIRIRHINKYLKSNADLKSNKKQFGFKKQCGFKELY